MSKVAVVYWSGTGNTEAMAHYIAQGIREAGAEADLYTSAEFSADKAGEYGKIALDVYKRQLVPVRCRQLYADRLAALERQ